MRLFKTDKVLVEKGKANEAYELLEKSGFVTYNSSRFRFDVNTALFTVTVVIMLIAAITSIL